MDPSSEASQTAILTKHPAYEAGQYFAVEFPDDGRFAMDDLQPLSENELLTEDWEPSTATADVEGALLDGMTDEDDFEASVLAALAAVGGELLFQMRLDNVEDCRHVAAVSLGSGDQRRVALVILPPEGAMRIEPADSSNNPVAGIARSYVGLVKAYKAAA